MKVHWFQHVAFEGLGLIEPWLLGRGHTLTSTRWWAGETAGAAAAECDWLIVMGGPMNIYQHRDHPWLVAEKAALAAALSRGTRVLGVCLGAQLLADVLGGKVMQNPEREIGWWPIQPVSPPRLHPNGGHTTKETSRYQFPSEITALHWHGDTFTLPPGARRLAETEACPQQAFAVGERILGLQFHLEMTAPTVAEITRACSAELTDGGRWVQTAETIHASTAQHIPDTSKLLARLLEEMEQCD